MNEDIEKGGISEVIGHRCRCRLQGRTMQTGSPLARPSVAGAGRGATRPAGGGAGSRPAPRWRVRPQSLAASAAARGRVGGGAGLGRGFVHLGSCVRLARSSPAAARAARSWHASQEMAATAMILTKLSLPPISARPPCCIVRSGERILRCNNLSSLPGCCWQYQPEPGSRVMLPCKALRSPHGRE